jgi:tryptophan synthase alpha chain
LGFDRIDTINRIEKSLTQSPAGLWPFVVAGYPSLGATAQLLRRLSALPIRGIEIGFPFSDPVADGPVIQRAFNLALEQGIRVKDIFDMLAAVRAEVSIPIMAMVSASIVYRAGDEAFVDASAAAGLDGLIIPDVPLEEATPLAELAAEKNLRFPMLIAPTTPADRRERIARAASGFLYYVSIQGTTGQRDCLPESLERQVREVREQTKMPVLVGFGIGSREQLRDVCGFANGGIVGSAIVQRMTQELERGADEDQVIEAAINFVGELAG